MAEQGRAWQGMAGQGMAWQGRAGQGRAPSCSPISLVQAGFAPITAPAAPLGASSALQNGGCLYPPSGYVLYMAAVNDNGYQMYSAGKGLGV